MFGMFSVLGIEQDRFSAITCRYESGKLSQSLERWDSARMTVMTTYLFFFPQPEFTLNEKSMSIVSARLQKVACA